MVNKINWQSCLNTEKYMWTVQGSWSSTIQEKVAKISDILLQA